MKSNKIYTKEEVAAIYKDNHTSQQLSMQEWAKSVKPLSFQDKSGGSNPPSCITLDLVDTETKNFHMRQIIKTYHKYRKDTAFLGRRINFLIKNNDKIIGMIGFGSTFFSLGPRDKYIGWKIEHKHKHLQKIAINWRYCLMEKQKCVTSKVMSLIYKQLPKLWKENYGDKLVLLETMIEKGYTGNSYKASGWRYIGETSGYEVKQIKHEDVKKFENISVIKQTFVTKTIKALFPTNNTKSVFIKPLCRDWKKILTTLTEIDLKKENITEREIALVVNGSKGMLTREGAIRTIVLRNRGRID